MTVYVKQYGAKRSGTNYTRWLLQENFPDIQVLSEILGWKHGPHRDTIDWSGRDWIDVSHGAVGAETQRQKLITLVTDDLRRAVASNELRYAVTVKNPYAWWDSYARFAETNRPDLAMTPVDGVDLWNSLYSNWHMLSQRQLAIMIRYEDLLLDLDATLDRTARQLRLPKKGEYRDAKMRMARRSDVTWSNGPTSKPFDPSHYTDKKYLSRFDGALLDIFRERLSAPLMEAFDYEML